MPEEEAFAVLVKIMYAYNLRELFKPSMAELGLRMFQLESMIQVCLNNSNNNNNNNYNDIYSAVIMTEVIARVHSVHLVGCMKSTNACSQLFKHGL